MPAFHAQAVVVGEFWVFPPPPPRILSAQPPSWFVAALQPYVCVATASRDGWYVAAASDIFYYLFLDIYAYNARGVAHTPHIKGHSVLSDLGLREDYFWAFAQGFTSLTLDTRDRAAARQRNARVVTPVEGLHRHRRA